MKTIDFTRPMWGHALHWNTFREKTAEGILDRRIDVLLRRRRYTVMVHSSSHIRPGDLIRYKTEGGAREAKITQVDWCADPRDMATLEIVIVRAL